MPSLNRSFNLNHTVLKRSFHANSSYNCWCGLVFFIISDYIESYQSARLAIACYKESDIWNYVTHCRVAGHTYIVLFSKILAPKALLPFGEHGANIWIVSYILFWTGKCMLALSHLTRCFTCNIYVYSFSQPLVASYKAFRHFDVLSYG